MTQFEILTDVLDLWTAGRKNAAKAQWKSLTKEFQSKVIEWALFILNTPQEILSTPLLEFRSPKFGNFNCSPVTLRALVEVVPEMV